MLQHAPGVPWTVGRHLSSWLSIPGRRHAGQNSLLTMRWPPTYLPVIVCCPLRSAKRAEVMATGRHEIRTS
ncbi:hypothetical protein C2E23DRAFT_805419 [Lenzites betulinus]|nr:hypothetical protein C2E23DRAFT_805419 [Lenzites betulinus]